MDGWGWLLAYEAFVVFGVVLVWAAWEVVKVERLRRRRRDDEAADDRPDDPPV